MSKVLSYKKQIKQNFLFAFPVMLSQLGHVLVGVSDSIMVGRLGKEALGAVSFSNSIFAIILTFGMGFSYALSPMVAAIHSSGDDKRIVSLFKNSMVLNILLSIGLFAVNFLVYQFLEYFGQSQSVISLSKDYILILGVSLFPVMLFQSGRQLAEGMSNTKTAMLISISANVLNVVFNYFLIYGNMGFPALGVAGAGYATFISRVLMAGMMFFYLFKSADFSFVSRYYHSVKLEVQHFKQLMKLGLGSGSQVFFEVSAFSMAAIMCGWIGEVELASHQIALNIVTLSYMMATGIGTAATVGVGKNFGVKAYDSMKISAYSNVFMCAAFMAVSAVLVILLKEILPTFYIDDKEVIILSAELLVIAALFQISDGIQVAAIGSLRGLMDVKIPTLIVFTAYWVLALPIGYLLAFKFGFGAHGIWVGLLIGLTISAALGLVRFYHLSNRLSLKS